MWFLRFCDRWNPEHFGDVPFQTDGNQVTIFWDSDEPPDPEDFSNQTWESARVLEQDTQAVQLVSSHNQALFSQFLHPSG